MPSVYQLSSFISIFATKIFMYLSSLLYLATCRKKNNCNLKKKNYPGHHYSNKRNNIMYTVATIQTAHTTRVESNLSCKTPPLSLPRPTRSDVIQWGHRIKELRRRENIDHVIHVTRMSALSPYPRRSVV